MQKKELRLKKTRNIIEFDKHLEKILLKSARSCSRILFKGFSEQIVN